MLVLHLQEGEILKIGNDIEIFVKTCQRGKVSLAIDAPRAVPIERVAEEPYRPEDVEVVARRIRRQG